MISLTDARAIVRRSDVPLTPVAREEQGEDAAFDGEHFLAAAWFESAATCCGGHNRAERLESKAKHHRFIGEQKTAQG